MEEQQTTTTQQDFTMHEVEETVTPIEPLQHHNYDSTEIASVMVNESNWSFASKLAKPRDLTNITWTVSDAPPALLYTAVLPSALLNSNALNYPFADLVNYVKSFRHFSFDVHLKLYHNSQQLCVGKLVLWSLPTRGDHSAYTQHLTSLLNLEHVAIQATENESAELVVTHTLPIPYFINENLHGEGAIHTDRLNRNFFIS